MMFRTAIALFLTSTAFSLNASAALVPDPTAPSVTQVVLGIEKPSEWTSIPDQYVGSMVLTTKAGNNDSGEPNVLSRRLDATLTMISDKILDNTVPATELTVNITRNETVIAKCVLDLGHALGSQAPQVDDYHLVLTQRSDTPFQALSGYCSTVDAASGALTPGIPNIEDHDVVRVEMSGLQLQSSASAL